MSTTNYYSPLTSVTTADTSVASTSRPTSKSSDNNATGMRVNKTSTPPPLVIEKKCVSSRLLTQIKGTLKNKYTSSYNVQGLRIQCTTLEDYNALQYFLAANRLQYFTYQRSSDQLIKLIIRGLPPTISEEEILAELQEMQFPAMSVRQFKRLQVDPITDDRSKVPLPIWLVTLHNQSGIKEKMKQLTGMFNLTIKVEDYLGSPVPVQCYKCQRFGHKAQGCNIQPKCVKCAGSHHTKECTKDPNTPATCTNCNGSHPANFRQCPRFLAYTRSSTTVQTAPPPSLNDSNFPRPRPTRGPIPGFQRQTSEHQENNNNALSDIKEIFSFLRSFDIKHYVSGFKEIIQDVSRQKDLISKCLSFISGISALFDNASEN